jgi:spore germination protein PB
VTTWNVQQNITIGQLRVEAVTNSSVLQIGTAGSIRALSQLYNTGGFTSPAPEVTASLHELALAPLPNPS